MTPLRIAVISTPVFRLGPMGLDGYGGLEQLAWQTAKGLAKKGHSVKLMAPDGSECPGVEVIGIGPERQIPEDQAYGGFPEIKEKVKVQEDGKEVEKEVLRRRKHEGYWQHLLDVDCVIDHSVAGDESLLVRIHGECKWLTFEQLFAWAMSCSPVVLEGGSAEVAVCGLEVPSAVDAFTVQWKPVSTVIRHLRKEAIHTVRVRGGNVVNVTAGHSLITAGVGGLGTARADNCVGTSVVTAREIPAAEGDTLLWPLTPDALRGKGFHISGCSVARLVEEHEEVLSSAVLLKKELKRESIRTRLKVWRNRSVPVDVLPELPRDFTIHTYGDGRVGWPVPLTEDDLVLFGLWVGDGCYDGDRAVCLASGLLTKGVADAVAEEMDSRSISSKERPDVQHRINSTLLVALMKGVGFTGDCYTKRIPGWVFGLSRRQIGLFLRGYFSSDGCASGRVSLGSVNEGLVRQVSVLLALCGIQSKVYFLKPGEPSDWNSNPVGGWELHVPNDELKRFGERVGFVQGYKNEKALEASLIGRRSWRGDIPYCLVRERKPRADKKRARERVISLARLARIKGEEAARQFAESSVSWRRITSSEPTGREDRYVYDLSVPGTENFFVGTVCCHNTWNKWSYILKREGRLKAPVLGVCHAPVNTMFSSPPPVEKPCIVCISRDQADHYEALFGRPGSARVCHNGIDLDYYQKIDGARRGDRFLFLARFSSIKGPDLAIEACLQAGEGLDLIGDTQITGEPEYLEACKRRADGRQINLIGGVSRGEAVWWFSRAHCMLHPNLRFREPLGLAPLEAQACGTPVIAWDFGALRETLYHCENFKSLVSTVGEFTQAVRDASRPGAITDKDREGCKAKAAEFSLGKMVDRYDELVHEAVNGGGW